VANFIEFEIETGEEQLLQKFYEGMAAQFPGWEPNPNDLEDWLARIWARMAVETAELAADVPPEIFQRFGEKILQVPPLEATSAIATTTWTFIDTAGYVINACTPVSIKVTGDEYYGFEVVDEVIVLPGDATAEDVLIRAIEPGEYAEGASGSVMLIDAIPNVESIELDAPATGGADAEDPEDYLNRLAGETRLLSIRPVLAKDVQILARLIPTIGRALALDLYDPGTDTWDNEKTTTIAVAKEDGTTVGSTAKTALETMLASYREQNYNFFVIDPTYTQVKVEFEITVLSGYNQSDVETTVSSAITSYLSPGTFASKNFSDDTGSWTLVTHVYRNELISLIDRVTGVDRVVNVRLAEQAGALGTSDVALDGPASLTTPGTITAV